MRKSERKLGDLPNFLSLFLIGLQRLSSLVLSELKPYLGKAMTLLLCFFKKDKVERGALAHELSLLHGNDDEETNKENPTGLRHVLLPSLSLYL